jgi:hypothetical protein
MGNTPPKHSVAKGDNLIAAYEIRGAVAVVERYKGVNSGDYR